jgi:hypothetical protein
MKNENAPIVEKSVCVYTLLGVKYAGPSGDAIKLGDILTRKQSMCCN